MFSRSLPANTIMKHCFVALAVASSCLRWILAVVVTPPDELLGIQSRRGTNIVPNVGDEDSSIMCAPAAVLRALTVLSSLLRPRPRQWKSGLAQTVLHVNR